MSFFGAASATMFGMAAENETSNTQANSKATEKPELIVSEKEIVSGDKAEQEDNVSGVVEEPAKVMRIGTMIKQLLDEVRQAPLDEKSRARLREIYETSVAELADGLSSDLKEELDRLTLPFDPEAVPSESELRIAQAQLVGWLEGLFHGIQATLFAQQAAARAQLDQMRHRGLPSGPHGGSGNEDDGGRPGTYL